MRLLRRFLNWVSTPTTPLNANEIDALLRPYHMDRWF